MRKILKRFTSFFLVPLTRWYLRKNRNYSVQGTSVVVRPGVFHPGLFHSSRFLLDYLSTQPVQGKSLLELGCGTGLISILAAKAGAHAFASDKSAKAVENTKLNVTQNRVVCHTIQSDLFDGMEKRTFDWIVINPPYYARNPASEDDLAWYCGENFEYFRKLFGSLGNYVHPATNVIMALSSDTAMEKIVEIGEQAGYRFESILEKKFWLEKNFLISIKPIEK